MKRQNSKWMLLALTIAAIAMFTTQPLQVEVLEKTMNVGGTTVHYKTVLPNDYDPGKAYPAIVALGGGPQTMNTVDNILDRNFREEAEKRGYIVVAPAAPDGQLFLTREPTSFPNFST
jgi:poly(3-hydroxybutyrate) depolymerase